MRCIPVLALILATPLWSQPPKSPPDKPAEQSKPQEQEPPEEDESLKPKTYAFNPLAAQHELQVGIFYYKKGNYKGARNRFLEATRWNPGYAEAFLRLGESEEKLKNQAAASEAYSKYLDLAPTAKDADSIRKKLAGKR